MKISKIKKEFNPVHYFGLSTFILFLIISLNSHTSLFSDLYLWLFVAITVSSFTFYLFIQTKNEKIKYYPYIILLWAISFRILGLTSAPFLEDDFYRFLWDGFIFSQLGTPYNIPPSLFFDADFINYEWNAILNGVSYPDLPTIYSPTLQYIFLLCSYIAPASELFLRILFTTFELCLLLVLYKLFKHSPAFILYAWCPLLIKEISFSTHPDIVGITFLFSGIMLVKYKYHFYSGLMLALAIACKPFAIILAPYFIFKGKLIALSSTLFGLFILYFPFVLKGSTEFSALLSISREWEFNSSIYAVLNTALTPQYSKALVGLIFAIVFFSYWYNYFRKGSTKIPRGDILFITLFLLSPVYNPWYTLWLLPFLLVYPSIWGWSIPIAVSFSYIIGLNLNSIEISAYDHPQWVRVIEFGIIIVFVAFAKLNVLKREPC